MKVPIKIYKSSGCIECNSEGCKFRRNCAVHGSAGDFRMEGGFTPQLEVISPTEADCSTYDRLVETSREFENFPDCSYPDNYDSLRSGLLVFTGDEVQSANLDPEEITLSEVSQLKTSEAIILLKKAGIIQEDGHLAEKYSRKAM